MNNNHDNDNDNDNDNENDNVFFLQMGTPCKPKCGCFLNKFTHEERQSIFSGYYSLETEQLKNQYLIGKLSKRPVKRSRTKNPNAEPKIQWY